jgi:hypothetical protein
MSWCAEPVHQASARLLNPSGSFMRTTRKTVTFQRSFILDGVDGIQPPGTYLVIIDEEEFPGMLFTAWRRVQTNLRIPSLDVDSGFEQLISVDPSDLEAAMAADHKKVA